MSPAPGLAVAACLALAPAAQAKVSLVVEDARQAREADALAGPDVSVFVLERERLGDPILKGRFLSGLQATELVVATGSEACGWLGREVEGVPVDCVAPYNAGQVLDFARAAGWRRIAAVHTPSYARFLGRLNAAARERGVSLLPLRAEGRRDLPGLAGRAASAQALWILGDPLLTEGAAFDYLVELSLSRRVPLIAPGVGTVARGAFLGVESEPGAVLRHAVAVATAAAHGDAAPEPGAPSRLRVNEVLARRWGLRVPGGPR